MDSSAVAGRSRSEAHARLVNAIIAMGEPDDPVLLDTSPSFRWGVAYLAELVPTVLAGLRLEAAEHDAALKAAMDAALAAPLRTSEL